MTEWAHRVRPQTVHQECRALQGCIIRHPPHHGGAPVEAHPKRVAQTALWSCRTVATGGRTAMRQRPPRAGIFLSNPRTKLSRKWGPGGRATKSTTWCSPEPSPGDLFAPFGSLQKGLAAGAAKCPKSNGTAQTRREGQAPPLQIPKGANGTGGSGTRPYSGTRDIKVPQA